MITMSTFALSRGLILRLTMVLALLIFFGMHFAIATPFHYPQYADLGRATPEQMDDKSPQEKREARSEAWFMSWFHNMQRKNYESHVQGYDIVKTEDLVDSTFHVYSLVVSRNDSIKFRTSVGVEDSAGVSYVLCSLIPNGGRQVIVEQYTGGAHCCHLYWILDLGDTVHVLYHSNEEETEIGAMGRVYDFDNDGRCEFTQYLNSFHYFDGLCGACSPGVYAIFKYSDSLGCYRPANREFPGFILEDIDKKKLAVKEFLDTTKTFNEELSTELMGLTLDVLIHYVYAGQDSLGWTYFDKNYTRPDKNEMKAKIQDVLNTSVVYRQMYHQ